MSNVYPVKCDFAGAKQLHGMNPVKCAAYFIGAKTLPRYFCRVHFPFDISGSATI